MSGHWTKMPGSPRTVAAAGEEFVAELPQLFKVEDI